MIFYEEILKIKLFFNFTVIYLSVTKKIFISEKNIKQIFYNGTENHIDRKTLNSITIYVIIIYCSNHYKPY